MVGYINSLGVFVRNVGVEYAYTPTNRILRWVQYSSTYQHRVKETTVACICICTMCMGFILQVCEIEGCLFLCWFFLIVEFDRDTVDTMSFIDLISILMSETFSLENMSLQLAFNMKEKPYQMSSTISTHNFNPFHSPCIILKSLNRSRNTTH
jgi:hypothetical protein